MHVKILQKNEFVENVWPAKSALFIYVSTHCVNYNYNYMAFIERKNYKNIHLRCTQGEIRFTKNDYEHIAKIMYTNKNKHGQNKNQ